MKFLYSVAFSVILVPLYLIWGRNLVEAQIDKMQEDAFNTPGVEAPITPSVVMAGVALLSGHFLWGRLIGLRTWQSVISLIAGAAIGVYAFLWRLERDAR
jgi:hypothetical protein